jgi:hypothetical protein
MSPGHVSYMYHTVGILCVSMLHATENNHQRKFPKPSLLSSTKAMLQHGEHDAGVVEDHEGDDVSVKRVYTWSYNPQYSGPYLLDVSGKLHASQFSYSSQLRMDQKKYYESIPLVQPVHHSVGHVQHHHDLKLKRKIFEIPTHFSSKSRSFLISKVKVWRRIRDIQHIKIRLDDNLLNVLGREHAVGLVEQGFNEWKMNSQRFLDRQASFGEQKNQFAVARQQPSQRSSNGIREFSVTWRNVFPEGDSASAVQLVGMYRLPCIRNVGMIAFRIPKQFFTRKQHLQGLKFDCEVQHSSDAFLFQETNAPDAIRSISGQAGFFGVDMAEKLAGVWEGIEERERPHCKIGCRLGKFLFIEKQFNVCFVPDLGISFFALGGGLVDVLMSRVPGLEFAGLSHTTALYCKGRSRGAGQVSVNLKPELHSPYPSLKVASKKQKFFLLNMLDSAERFDFRIVGARRAEEADFVLPDEQKSGVIAAWMEQHPQGFPQLSLETLPKGYSWFSEQSQAPETAEGQPSQGPFELFSRKLPNLQSVRVKTKLKFRLGHSLNINLSHILEDSDPRVDAQLADLCRSTTFEISCSSPLIKSLLVNGGSRAEFSQAMKTFLDDLLQFKKILENL